jgi:hypothetical protein
MQRLKLSPEKKKAEQDKKRLYMKRCREAESTHKAATRKNNNNASNKRKHQNESTDAAATRKNNNNASKKRKRQNESTDAAATQNVNNNASRKRRRQRQQQNFSTMSQDEEMSHAIERAMKEAKQTLHRTQNPTNPQSHRAIVCNICDRFIIGTEKIHKLSSYQISQHTNRLSVKTNKTYHGVELKIELKKVPGE